jgi:biotin carboxyl carrier protein
VSDEIPPEARVVEGQAARPQVDRSDAERAADHAAIADSIDELLPALIAKLGSTGLAELEVREDAIRVRLRRPADGALMHSDRAARSDRSRGAAGASPSHAPGLMPVGPGREVRDGRDGRTGGDGHAAAHRDERRAVATSPAVGIYHPRAEASGGTKVRAGDRLGTVDMLGVPQEVVAPTDGLIGASLVEAGDAVEYGQELVVIEFASAVAGGPAPSDAPPLAPDH